MNVDNSWAEVEVRSPIDGVILEKNIVAGDIVDTTLDLFKIADMNVLGVMANVYEEDLPKLEALVPAERRWSVQLKSQPDASPIDGTFDLIGSIVDPNQHTAAVMGWLDNRDGRLRAGQFITAAIELPVTDDEVMIPDTALVEGADSGTVLVASDESARQVTRRKVALVSRGGRTWLTFGRCRATLMQSGVAVRFSPANGSSRPARSSSTALSTTPWPAPPKPGPPTPDSRR